MPPSAPLIADTADNIINSVVCGAFLVLRVGIDTDDDFSARAAGHNLLVRLQHILVLVYRVRHRLQFACERTPSANFTGDRIQHDIPSSSHCAINNRSFSVCFVNMLFHFLRTPPRKTGRIAQMKPKISVRCFGPPIVETKTPLGCKYASL